MRRPAQAKVVSLVVTDLKRAATSAQRAAAVRFTFTERTRVGGGAPSSLTTLRGSGVQNHNFSGTLDLSDSYHPGSSSRGVLHLRVVEMDGHLRSFTRGTRSRWTRVPAVLASAPSAALQVGSGAIWWPSPVLSLLRRLAPESVVHATRRHVGEGVRESVTIALGGRITGFAEAEQAFERSAVRRNHEAFAFVEIWRPSGGAMRNLTFTIDGRVANTPIRQTITFDVSYAARPITVPAPRVR